MIQTREDFPLGEEARDDGLVRQRRCVEQLDRDLLLELAVDALGQPHHAHAAFAELTQQGVVVRLGHMQRVVGERSAGVRTGLQELGVRTAQYVEQPYDFLAQVRVAGALIFKVTIALAFRQSIHGADQRSRTYVRIVLGFGHDEESRIRDPKAAQRLTASLLCDG